MTQTGGTDLVHLNLHNYVWFAWTIKPAQSFPLYPLPLDQAVMWLLRGLGSGKNIVESCRGYYWSQLCHRPVVWPWKNLLRSLWVMVSSAVKICYIRSEFLHLSTTGSDNCLLWACPVHSQTLSSILASNHQMLVILLPFFFNNQKYFQTCLPGGKITPSWEPLDQMILASVGETTVGIVSSSYFIEHLTLWEVL